MFQMMLHTAMNAYMLDVVREKMCEQLYMVGGWFFKSREAYIYINNINRGFLVPDNSPSTSFHSIQLSNAGDGQMSNRAPTSQTFCK